MTSRYISSMVHLAAGWVVGGLGQQLLDFVEAIDQTVDIFHDIIQVETGPRRSGQVVSVVQRHGAVMAGPHCNTVAVQHLGYVMRVDVLQREGGYPAAPLGRRAVDAHARYF